MRLVSIVVVIGTALVGLAAAQGEPAETGEESSFSPYVDANGAISRTDD